MSRYATSVCSTFNHGVPSREGASRDRQKPSRSISCHNCIASQQSPPLPRAFEPQFAQVHSNRIDIVRGHRTSRKQCNLSRPILVMHLDGLAPRLALAGVDLAQVQYLALRNAPAAQTPALDNAPILVDLAVLHSSIAA